MRWEPIGWVDRLIIALTILFLGALTVRLLPTGVCFGDSGDLQVASATLGITHPPGYPGYVSVGYLLTWMPGTSPAYMVSLACWASGLLVLALCILMQVRLGVMPVLACAIAVGLTASNRVWSNLLAPEVYMPTLFLEAVSAYLLVKYTCSGRRRHFFGAAMLFGFALANRPPVAFALPFFAGGGWLATRRWDRSCRQSVRSLILAGGLATVPVLYSFGYLWVRDTPETPHNFIEVYNADYQELPEESAGFRAKVERVVWQATARLFGGNVGYTWAGLGPRLRWLAGDFLPHRPVALAIALAIVLLGAIVAHRRSPVAVWVVAGMAVASVAFVCTYRIYGQAADLLPLWFAVAVLGGEAVSVALGKSSKPVRQFTGAGLLLLVVVWTVTDVANRFPTGRNSDAESYLRTADVATLPQNAQLCTAWGLAAPLRYAVLVRHRRHDVDFISTHVRCWKQAVERFPHRPTFLTTDPGPWPGYMVTPYRNLFRVEPVGTKGSTAPGRDR